MKKLTLFTCALLLTICGTAQTDKPIFDSYQWDFGNIDEAKGSVCHTFYLHNNTKNNIVVARAIPSCSCINANFDNAPIAPHSSGMVEVCFSPHGASGITHRNIEIVDNKGELLGTLSIKANVIPAYRSIPERYPFALGNQLYIKKNEIPFGYVAHGTTAQKTIQIANASNTPMTIEVLPVNTPELQIICPEKLIHWKESAITLKYKMPANKDFHKTFVDTIFLLVNKQKTSLPIIASAICLTKNTNNTNAPIMQTYPSVAQLSTQWFSNSIKGSITITNKGKSDLIIEDMEVPNGVSINIKKGTIIKPNSKLIVEAETNSHKSFKINLFSNDPQRPYKELLFNNTKQ